MKTTTISRRWLALPVACAQVSAPSPIATTAAHVLVGYGSVASGPASGTTLARLERPVALVQGTNGFAAKQSVIDMDPDGGVRGKPPRGWPV